MYICNLYIYNLNIYIGNICICGFTCLTKDAISDDLAGKSWDSDVIQK